MHNCDSLDPLVTPFIDGELPDPDRRAVEDHLRVCPPCHSRIRAERAVHDLLRARRDTLCRTEAPDALHLRCAALVHRAPAAPRDGKATAETSETAESGFSWNQNREPGTRSLGTENQQPRTENQRTENLRTKNPRTENLRTPNPGTSNRGTPHPSPRTPHPALFPRPLPAYALAPAL